MMDIGKDLKDAYEQGYKDRDSEIVRCKDCYWYDKGKNDCDSWEWCKRHKFDSYDEGFCSWGERREE